MVLCCFMGLSGRWFFSYRFCFKVLSGPVWWCAKKQSTIALSTAEAEYVALSHAVQEAIWLRHLLKDLGYLQLEATPIYEDNQACIKIAKNDMVQARTKHINIRYHFSRQAIKSGEVKLIYCQKNKKAHDCKRCHV